MQDKWDLFWMGIIFFIVVMFVTLAWNWRVDGQREGAWNSGYMAGYAEGKADMVNRLAPLSQ